MARIEHIKRRLDNWALWKARMCSSGLGYHAVNVLAVDVWSRNSYNGNVIPHIDQEGEETNQAIEAMRVGKMHLYETLHAYYLQDLGVQLIARRMGKSPSTIHAHLSQADCFIAGWLQERARMREEQEALARGREWTAMRGSFTP